MTKSLHFGLAAAALVLGTIYGPPVKAQTPDFDQLKQATDDITALITADEQKSEVCKNYIGQLVTPVSFDALVRAVPRVADKSEFETTDQYRARIAAAEAHQSGGPYVLSMPVNRAHIRYDADIQAMFVERGAFGTGRYSEEALADLTAWGAEEAAAVEGTPIFHSRGAARAVRSYAATSRSGVPFRVSEFERHTNAFYVIGARLFPFAERQNSPVMGFDVPLARASALKDAIKIALVATPRFPYLYTNSMGPIVPSLGTPNVYKESVTVAIVAAECGLVIDAQNRVLASMDIGS